MWYIFAFLSAIFSTTYTLLMRTILKDKGDPKVFAVLLQFIIALTLLFLIPFEETTYLFNPTNLVILFFVILGTAVIAILFVRGRQLEEASNVPIGIQTSRVWNLIGAALILGEPITTYKILGVTLIIIGNLLVLYKGQKIKLSKGMVIIIIASLLFATINFGDKYLLRTFSTALYNFILYSVSSIILFAFIGLDFKKIKNEYKLHGPISLLVGMVFGVNMYFFQKAIQLGEVSRVAPINGISIIFTVLLGILLLNEKENLWKKILAAIIVFTGAYLLII